MEGGAEEEMEVGAEEEMEGGAEEEPAVGHRWTRTETVVLVNALKAREEEAHDVAAKSAVGTAGDKWETVSKFCRSRGVARSSAQCNSRWSKGLYLDYRKVRDWQKNEGVESYWKMKEKKRREHRLPRALDEEVYNVLVSFLDPDLKQTGTPESELDSDSPSLLVSTAPGIDKNVIQTHRAVSSTPASASTPSHHSGSSDGAVGSMLDFARLQARATSGESLQSLKSQIGAPSGEDKKPVISGLKRKRASSASAVAASSYGRADIADTPNNRPVHLNVPPLLDIPRFSEPNVPERSNTPHWDGQSGLASLEARLLAQNEAIWNRVRMLNEQVVQAVDLSNQRLLGQMQSLFTQIRLQLQVISAQMQAQVHESTRSVQAELQTVLKTHTEQIFSQLQSQGGCHPQGQALPKERPIQDVNWSGDRTSRPSPPDIQVDFSQLPVPPLQPLQLSRDKERVVLQRSGEQAAEGLLAPQSNSRIQLLPHISDVQKAETLAVNKSRLPPHMSDVDRILRQQQVLPSPLPHWNQASFVISELDRVLGHKPLDIHMIPPAPGPSKGTYVVNDSDRPLLQPRAHIFESTLQQPGRFDRQVQADHPDAKGRTYFLKAHFSNKNFTDDVSLEAIAMRTHGFSEEDIVNLLNEAAILSGTRGKAAISLKEIDDTIHRMVLGVEGTLLTDAKRKSLVAYHEVGHAICGTLTLGHDAVQKFSLVSGCQTRNPTWFLPEGDPTLASKHKIFAHLVGALGGRAIEEVVFGEVQTTSGASDLKHAISMAKQMVAVFGMSDNGPWASMDSSPQTENMIIRTMARNSIAEKFPEDIDQTAKTIFIKAYEMALGHIRNNRAVVDKIVEVLLEKETLSGEEFRAILSEYTQIPAENRQSDKQAAPVRANTIDRGY